jgi:hypothetical protein
MSGQVLRIQGQASPGVGSYEERVAYPISHEEVSRQANEGYLDALAVVDNPTSAIQQLDDVTRRKNAASGRGVRAFNPLLRDDTQPLKAIMAVEHCIRGLSNADIRARLEDSPHSRDLADQPKRQCAKVSRILNRFHTHKLIAKIPHTRRWGVTDRAGVSWQPRYAWRISRFLNYFDTSMQPDLSCTKAKRSWIKILSTAWGGW